MFKRVVATIAACTIAAATAVTPARAQSDDRLSLIRDTEVENTIRTFGTPLWKAAGLTPSSIHIILVNDRTLNAFVAGGQNLFINTGLLIRADSAGEVIGVIAHETGHMAGGHLARMPEAMRNAMFTSLIAMALGALGGVAGGGGSVGAAGVVGGMSMGERNLFAFSRSVENAADQAGMTFLDMTGQSARGMLQFMEVLSHKEVLSSVQQDPYLRTHPLTSERIDAIRYHVEHSRYSDVPVPPELERLDRRMRAKLAAFLDPPSQTLAAYSASDTSLEARYARAIAYYRIPDLKSALPLIDGLIAEYPKDPYFYELRSQMLFENGKVADALPAQREAVALLPDAALMRVDLAHIELELNDPSLVPDAEQNLTLASRVEPDLPDLWRLLAVAQGRNGDIGQAAVALAEQALLEGRRLDARDQARRAMRMLPVGSPGWLKAQDVEGQALRSRE
ncbi:MAG TPA: M48 family metalloprotease [Candidatus Sulfotelmatobacter sp.]|nr:M48 family metalloprotease [Candidatus Sulfotelmatobacter sp.]